MLEDMAGLTAGFGWLLAHFPFNFMEKLLVGLVQALFSVLCAVFHYG